MVIRALLAGSIAIIAFGSSVRAAPISGQISIGGYVAPIGSTSVDVATGLDFVSGPLGARSPDVAGAITSYGGGYGSFAGLSCVGMASECGRIADIANFSTFSPLSNFLVLNTSAGPTIIFDLNSISSISRSGSAAGVADSMLGILGSGEFHFSGYDDTAASFSLTTQAGMITSFSATLVAVPTYISEAPSIALLGAALCTIGIIRRRDKV